MSQSSKTLLAMVNWVLVELREAQVTDINATTYSTLITQWINDAKRQVEDAWDWQPLNYVVDLAIVPSTLNYVLTDLFTDLSARARLQKNPANLNLPMAIDMTASNPFNLIESPVMWINQMRDRLPTPQLNTTPINFGLERFNTGSTEGINLKLWETPTTTRQWRLYFTSPQEDLLGNFNSIKVPWVPVVSIALDVALSERGEEIGEPGTTIDQRVHTHIGNAISVDATFQDYKLDFYPA